MFGWEYPPLHLGGLGVACQGLVRGLLKRGVRVTLALPHAGSEQDTDTVHPTTKTFEAIKVCSLLSPYDTGNEYATRVHKIPADVRDIYGADLGQAIEYFTASAVEMTKDVQTNVVHCHDWMTYEAGIRAARYHRKPLVTHIHATELDRTNFAPNEWIYKREQRGFAEADQIIAVSDYTKNVLIKHYGVPAEKIAVVHNGNLHAYMNTDLKLRWEIPRRHRPMALFLGRLALQKGVHQFLDMAAEVHRQRPEVEFVIAGAGHMFDELIERTIQLGLGHSVVFAGKVNSDEAKLLYSQADCFVMPSLSEPFGLVALEAIAHGTPVILSKQSGVSEVVSHGFTVDFWDTHKMADCVLTVLRDEPLAHQMRTESHRDLQRLSWENQAGQVQSIYNHILQNN